jgi:hypothetical protein
VNRVLRLCKASREALLRNFFRVPQKNFCGLFNRVQAFACGPMQRCIEACFIGGETSLQVDKASFVKGARMHAKTREQSSSSFMLQHAKWKLIQEKQ